VSVKTVPRIIIIGGPELVRVSVARFVDAQPNLVVQGSFASVADLRRRMARLTGEGPLIAVLDVDASGRQQTIEEFKGLGLECRIVLLCEKLDDEIVACARAHAVNGVLLKSYSLADVRAALDHILTGHVVMPAGWHDAAAPVALSPRLRQVLELIAEGQSNEEIAERLGLSPNTVKFYVRDLYQRLGVRNRIEASQRRERLLGAAS